MGATIGPYPRPLDEFDVFVRDKRSVDILHKVVAANERPFEEIVSGDTPFGLATNFSGYKRDVAPKNGQVRLYANVGTTRVRGAMTRATIKKNSHLIDVWKLFLPKTGFWPRAREKRR
jgi:site-specific DNA-methyltransferase (adenine-specific)